MCLAGVLALSIATGCDGGDDTAAGTGAPIPIAGTGSATNGGVPGDTNGDGVPDLPMPEAGSAAGAGAGAGGGAPTLDPGPGEPPSTPTLKEPSNEAVDVPTSTALCWNESTDPEGDAIRYRVIVDELELASGKVDVEGFGELCTDPLVFNPDRTYRWRVSAFDADAPQSESPFSDTWRFTTRKSCSRTSSTARRAGKCRARR
jgi:hypothetical protein